ncbi:MAG: ABC transporter, permease protein (cluster 13, osmolytes) [uncultured Acidimicrobiales bacterium]|uniref:ABC transporter, permease protein (Cluster 13, osmolytes) n=1 Tax=uncultured Acidimicrobiales bacterium TaxID=310071 RepID=A0A6J4HLL4_9ACTN|nr:MAG: ABC transporter, permease protein (cluster 13, osmolytes) [uncultured Acidimicrobiales bacterium]
MVVAAASDGWLWWDWVARHVASSPVSLSLVDSLREHASLTVLSVVLAQLISLPLAVVATRSRPLETALLSVLGVVYTVPSLALFAFLVPLTGLSRTSALIGLTAYNLLVMVRNDITGLVSVPPDVKEAAAGLGLSPLRQLLTVEVPLALPAIVAGARVATVSTVALVPITALIGQGGFGQFINEGLQDLFKTPLTVGITCSIALAVLADVALLGLERRLSPWSRT